MTQRREINKLGLRVESVICRVSFECGCSWDRVFLGEFQGRGEKLRLCHQHSQEEDQVRTVAIFERAKHAGGK